MNLKLYVITLLFFASCLVSAQQIGEGYAPTAITNFSSPLKSGVYNGLKSTTTGMTPDQSNVWQHLFVARHTSINNNFQLQIASSFTINDRLFFRKIVAGDLSSPNIAWVELATRGENNFDGNQIINGNVGSNKAVLEINSSAIVGAETLLQVKVSDASQDYLKITNGTSGDGQFIPVLQGYHVSDNRAALYLTGKIESANDSGVDPVMTFDSRLSDSSVKNRPLFSWDSYGNKKMTLTSNGSLGIGTITTGTHKLAVEGSIGAREIKVQATGWADFVFKKEYNLPGLEEVEKYIAEKGHLENIPSEEEVLKNGINLGEMNAKLLQKIEELTLYVIEMKKENEIMKNDILKLKQNK